MNRVAVVGAGTMGQGIALSCALAGKEALLYDIQPAQCDRALAAIRNQLSIDASKGRIAPDAPEKISNLIKATSRLADITSDLVIEAAVENHDIKVKLFSELEAMAPAHTLFTSNTSSLSITNMATALKDPSRLAGLHFFNPADRMKLVEVIVTPFTTEATLVALRQFAAELGKTAVTAKDSPGFIVNRVARHFYVEALKLAEDKMADVQTIDKLMRATGFRMGPFELMDLIGMDVNLAVTTSVWKGFDHAHRFTPSSLQKSLVEAGKLGRKTGSGFYSYEK